MIVRVKNVFYIVPKILQLTVESLNENHFLIKLIGLNVEIKVKLREISDRIIPFFLIRIDSVTKNVIRLKPFFHSVDLILRTHIYDQLEGRIKLSKSS